MSRLCQLYHLLLNTLQPLSNLARLSLLSLLFLTCADRACVYARNGLIGFPKSLSPIPSQILSCIEDNLHQPISKEWYTSPRSLPPFSINSSHCNRKSSVPPISPFTSIRNAWNTCAKYLNLFSPRRHLFKQLNQILDSFKFFLACVKTNHPRKCSGVFHLPYIPKILGSSSSAIFVEDVRCLQMDFFIHALGGGGGGFQWSFESVRTRSVKQFDEKKFPSPPKSHWL